MVRVDSRLRGNDMLIFPFEFIDSFFRQPREVCRARAEIVIVLLIILLKSQINMNLDNGE